jgi:hypothetical protein
MTNLKIIEKWVKEHQDLEGKIEASELMDFINSLK